MSTKSLLALFATFLAIATFFSFNSSANLSEKVAIHFAADGTADDWTSREQYRVFILLALISLPSLLVGVMAGLPRLTDGRGQIPNCEYWFSGERRQATEDFLLRHSCWLGCMTVAVIYGIHIFILRANATTPPRLEYDHFIAMISLYLIGLGWWMGLLLRRFRMQ